MPVDPRDDARRDPARPRRPRYTVWSLLAPVGAIVLFILMFSAVGDSCIAKHDCDSSKSSTADAANKLANDLKSKAKAKVKPGDSIGAIAARFNLTQADLIACNPTIDPQSLQPGVRLNVAAVDCEGQDLAPAGANPDPLAGDTTAAKPTKTTPKVDPTKNGTAAADPSVDAAKADANQ